MGMWTNHRIRQAGKYQKQMARQQQRVAYSPPAPPPMPSPVVQGASPVQMRQVWQDGWQQGWRAAQRDLVEALLDGRLSWEDAVERTTGRLLQPGDTSR